MATFRNPSFERIVQTALKKTAAALRDADVPFCLIGSLSAWVRGGPESSHDLDFGIRAEDIMRAAEALEAVGMEIEIPPEDWLIKALDRHPEDKSSDAPVLVDLIYAPSGVVITDEVLARADYMDVLAHKMRVLDATDLMVMKLLSLREQHLNMTSSISTARAIREQIDWSDLRVRCEGSPYAAGFFVIAEELGICPPADDGCASGAANTVLASMQVGTRLEDIHRQREMLVEHLRAREERGK